MNSITRWTLDKDKELTGIWVDLGNGEKARIRPSGKLNHEQLDAMRQGVLDAGYNSPSEMPNDEFLDLLVSALANQVLIDWKGFTGRDNLELEPTFENKKLLLSQELFRSAIVEEAEKIANFLIDENEEAEKN